MNCPACNTLLTKSSKHDIQINHCSNCGGAWLEKNELDKISYKAGIRPDEIKNNPARNTGNTEREDDHGSHTNQ